MREIFLTILIFLNIAVLLYFFDFNSQKVSDLSRDLERERSFNARQVRLLKWTERPESINLTACAEVYHVLGVKPSVCAALLYTENGPEDIESGSADKIDYFLKFSIQDRSALTGCRDLNRFAWTWFTSTTEGKKAFAQFLFYASGPYTSMSPAQRRAWTVSMLKNEQKFNEKMRFVTGGDSLIIMAHATPTPDWNAGIPEKDLKSWNPKKRRKKR